MVAGQPAVTADMPQIAGPRPCESCDVSLGGAVVNLLIYTREVHGSFPMVIAGDALWPMVRMGTRHARLPRVHGLLDVLEEVWRAQTTT